jgi:hypothetical protein
MKNFLIYRCKNCNHNIVKNDGLRQDRNKYFHKIGLHITNSCYFQVLVENHINKFDKNVCGCLKPEVNT